uniref:Uncharacterized protein n=1 Tax=Arion vulgaris TaxID=1028688 RepID=A0A0B7AH22_9EUPU
METQFTKISKTISGKVFIKSVHLIECFAHSQLGDKHNVKLNVKAKIYDPIITCNNSYAYEGQMNPVLACTVDYDGLNIKSFKFEIGEKTFEEGKHNPDFVKIFREDLAVEL